MEKDAIVPKYEKVAVGGRAYSVVEKNDGYILVGALQNNSGIIMKLGKDGKILWSKTSKGILLSVDKTSDGNYIASGYVGLYGPMYAQNNPSLKRYIPIHFESRGSYVVKFNENGERIWSIRNLTNVDESKFVGFINRPSSVPNQDVAYAVIEAQDGYLVLLNYYDEYTRMSYSQIVKIDNDGNFE